MNLCPITVRVKGLHIVPWVAVDTSLGGDGRFTQVLCRAEVAVDLSDDLSERASLVSMEKAGSERLSAAGLARSLRY